MDKFTRRLIIAILLLASPVIAATNEAPASVDSDEAAWSQHVINTFKVLQEQQQTTTRAVEQAREEARAEAKKSSQALQNRLEQLELTVSNQHVREINSLNKSHKSTMTTVLVIAGVGLVALLFFGTSVLRTVKREVSAVTVQPLPETVPYGRLTNGSAGLAHLDPAQKTNGRLLTSLDRLEQRLNDLETATETPGTETSQASAMAGGATLNQKIIGVSTRVALMLGKGQALSNLQQLDTAVAVFDEVIALDPNNADAYVKKGAALEKLGRLEDALQCYDQAIGVDRSMTMAYLCKGGVFNRLERYNEALQCYEEALRTDENTAG